MRMRMLHAYATCMCMHRVHVRGGDGKAGDLRALDIGHIHIHSRNSSDTLSEFLCTPTADCSSL